LHVQPPKAGAKEHLKLFQEINEAEDSEAKLEKETELDLFANPYTAAQRGFVDEVPASKTPGRKLLSI
jgi:propionyl-CoA carboxylase beta chain